MTHSYEKLPSSYQFRVYLPFYCSNKGYLMEQSDGDTPQNLTV